MNPVTWAKSLIRLALQRKKFPTSSIFHGAIIDGASNLGDYSVLFRDVSLITSSVGAYSYVQSGSFISNATIGKFCSIASNVSIGLANHPLHMVSSSPVFYDNTQPLPKFLVENRLFSETLPKTVIGADVWIGQGAMIKAGITIGVGAVIGAGSVVTKDIEPYVIAAGNPCRKIRLRFAEDVVQQLIGSKWWELPDATLIKLAPTFIDPQIFLKSVKQ
jgi:acetyltransferase-like isoleucine patch superfamily enzyme